MIRKMLLASVATLFLATGTVHAGGTLIPPVEYDYLFPGPIVVTRKDNPDGLTGLCRRGPGALMINGCAARV